MALAPRPVVPSRLVAEPPPTPPFRLPEDAGERDVLAKRFRGLGDPIRLAVLDLLAEHGELPVTALVEAIGEPQPKVSNHLAALRWCGFVDTRRASRQVFYSIADPRVLEIVEMGRALLVAPPAPEPEPEPEPDLADAETSATDGGPVLAFRLADGEYGIALARVREVLRRVATRTMPGLPPDAEGVASHRGAVLVVRDAARRLGVPSDGTGGAVIVVQGARGPIGWRVDRVAGIVQRDGAALAPAPVGSEEVESVLAVGDRLVLVLRPSALGA